LILIFFVDDQPALAFRSWTFDKLGSNQVWILVHGDWMKSVVSGLILGNPHWRGSLGYESPATLLLARS
jgi:hypothetical protein